MKRLIRGILFGNPDGPLLIVNFKDQSLALEGASSWLTKLVLGRLTWISRDGDLKFDQGFIVLKDSEEEVLTHDHDIV